jgi:TrmH family RNA methyltransferase
MILSSRRENDLQKMSLLSDRVCCLPAKLFQRLSRVKSNQGILAFFAKPIWRWSQLTPFVLFLDRLQDPGNLGTIFRTAAATGIFSIVTSQGTVSCYNEKVVRASSGYLFQVPFLQSRTARELNEKGYRISAAVSDSDSTLFESNLQPPMAFLVGNEGKGPEPDSLREATGTFRIPMSTGVESLNAAVAAAVIMYEVVRRQVQHD